MHDLPGARRLERRQSGPARKRVRACPARPRSTMATVASGAAPPYRHGGARLQEQDHRSRAASRGTTERKATEEPHGPSVALLC